MSTSEKNLPETMTMTEIAKAANCSVQYVHQVMRDVRHKGWAPGGTRSEVNRGPTKLYPNTWVAKVIKRREIVAAKHAKHLHERAASPASPATSRATTPVRGLPAGDFITRTDISKAVHDSGTAVRERVKKLGIKPVFVAGRIALYARADAERVVAWYAKRLADAEHARVAAAEAARERAKEADAARVKAAAPPFAAITPKMTPHERGAYAAAARRGKPDEKAQPLKSAVEKAQRLAQDNAPAANGARAATVDDVEALRLFVSDDLKRLLAIFERSAGDNTLQQALNAIDELVRSLEGRLVTLRGFHMDEFAGLGKRITALGDLNASAITHMDVLAQRLEALISRGEKNHVTLTGVTPKFDELDKRLDDLTRMVRGINGRLDAVALGPKSAAPFNPVLTPGDR